MSEKKQLVQQVLEKRMGSFALGGQSESKALRAFEMGQAYAQTRRFDNSRHYHNYQYRLDDGSRISSSSYFNQFMSRNQTRVYVEAEKLLKEFINDDKELLFHLVREQRFGINGVFKAIMSPEEPQQLNYVDYLLIVASFCAGYMDIKN